MFNDNLRYEPSESETKAVNKSYVFQKGSLFIPAHGRYGSRVVLAPYTVLKPFSIEQVIGEFFEQLEIHSLGLEDEMNKIIALMVGARYIRRADEAAVYDFGAHRFLGDPVTKPATGSIISRSSEYLNERLLLLKDNDRNNRN